MANLSYLFSGTPPPAVNSTVASTNGLPDWYQAYLQGIAGKATDIAGQQQSQGAPQQSVAGFTPDQTQAFQQVRNNQGAWKPDVGQAQGMVGQAQQAVAGPSANFTNNYQQYMSPYTQNVTDTIAQQGNQNFANNIMPQINSQMIGSGQFGSTRNADVLGKAGAQAQADITAQQAQALQNGYTTAGQLFNQDATRQQQQQQMQGTAALQGASQMGALGQMTSALGLTDAQAMQASGQQQQQLQQQGLNTNYSNAVNNNNYDMNNLNNLSSLVRGVQLPTTQTSQVNTPVTGGTFSQSPLAQVGSALATTAGSA